MADIFNAGNNTAMTSDLSGSPSASDDVIFATGKLTYQSATNLAGTNLGTVSFREAFAGDFGPDAPFLCQLNQSGAGLLLYQGSGRQFHFGGGGGSVVIDEVRFDPPAGCSGVLGAANVGALIVKRGSMRLKDDADVADLAVLQGGRLYGTNGLTAPTTLRVAGYCEWKADAGAVVIEAGGELVVDDQDFTPVGHMEVHGTFRPIRHGSIADDFTLYPGAVLDLRAAETDWTVSGSGKVFTSWAGAVIMRRPGGPGVVVTGSATTTSKFGGATEVFA